MEVKKLEDSQLEAFDHQDFVTENLFAFIAENITNEFPNGFSFLDVGGGNGKFSDKILENYPLARATVVDNSQFLLSKNVPHPRKRMLLASTTELRSHFSNDSFDLIFFNLSLHHFVTNGYSKTREIQSDAIFNARTLLKSCGRICVVENNFDGVLSHNFPGWLIFQLTSNRALAPFIKKLGANTSGIGVCFLSTKEWLRTFLKNGLTLQAFRVDYPVWDISLSARMRNILLTIRNRPRIAFWLVK